MRRLLGHLTCVVSVGVLFASIGAGEAKAVPVYQISVTVVDNTTPSTTNYNILNGGPFDGNTATNGITQSGLDTTSSGVILSGLNSVYTENSAVATLSIGGSAQINDSSTDSYTITITTTYNNYTSPNSGGTNTLTQSESGTYTYTGSGNTQNFQSWFYNGSSADNMTGPTPGMQTIAIPTTGASTLSGNANTPFAVTVPPYTPAFTLTNQIVLNLTGSGVGTNSQAGFSGSTTLNTVPEPASIVMFLTGMPMPLMVLGMLRRRKAAQR